MDTSLVVFCSVFKGNTILGQYAGGALLIANYFGAGSNNVTVNHCLFADNIMGPDALGGQGAGLAFQVVSQITVKYSRFIHNALVGILPPTTIVFLSLSTIPFL